MVMSGSRPLFMRTRFPVALAFAALSALVLSAAACSSSSTSTASPDGGAPDMDASVPVTSDAGQSKDAGVVAARCKATGTFGAPTLVGGTTSADNELSAWLTPDELTIYVTRTPVAGGDTVIVRGTRADRDAAFGALTPFPLPTMSGSLTWVAGSAQTPSFTDDENTVAFVGYNSVGVQYQIAVSTRTSATSPWSEATLLDRGGSYLYREPYFARGGAALYFSDGTGGSSYLVRTNMDATGGYDQDFITWYGDDDYPVISRDELTIFFRNSSATTKSGDILTTHRKSTAVPFGQGSATIVPELSSPKQDAPVWLSPDGCALYMVSDRAGDNYDLYRAVRSQ